MQCLSRQDACAKGAREGCRGGARQRAKDFPARRGAAGQRQGHHLQVWPPRPFLLSVGSPRHIVVSANCDCRKNAPRAECHVFFECERLFQLSPIIRAVKPPPSGSAFLAAGVHPFVLPSFFITFVLSNPPLPPSSLIPLPHNPVLGPNALPPSRALSFLPPFPSVRPQSPASCQPIKLRR